MKLYKIGKEEYFYEKKKVDKDVNYTNVCPIPFTKKKKKNQKSKNGYTGVECIKFSTNSQHSIKYLFRGLKACTHISIYVSHGVLSLNSKIFNILFSLDNSPEVSQKKYSEVIRNSPQEINTIIDDENVKLFESLESFRKYLLDKWIKKGIKKKTFKTILKVTGVGDKINKDLINELDLSVEKDEFALLKEESVISKPLETRFKELMSNNDDFSIVFTAKKHTTVVVVKDDTILYFDSSKRGKFLLRKTEMNVFRRKNWMEITKILRSRWGKRCKQCDFSRIVLKKVITHL